MVYVELPEPGMSYEQGEACTVVESVKAASDAYAPVSGEVIEANGLLEDSPELVNTDPYGEGWLFRIALSNPSEVDDLLDADALCCVAGRLSRIESLTFSAGTSRARC